jgi:hypothetical protein
MPENVSLKGGVRDMDSLSLFLEKGTAFLDEPSVVTDELIVIDVPPSFFMVADKDHPNNFVNVIPLCIVPFLDPLAADEVQNRPGESVAIIRRPTQE